MTVEMWMALGLIMAVVGFVLYKYGQGVIRNGNKDLGSKITLVAWFLLVVGIMIAFAFFRVKYLS